MRESHPELCFQSFNKKPLRFYKKSSHGISERLQILDNVHHSLTKIYNAALSHLKRKDVARDDILDALILAVSAATPPKLLQSIPEQPEKDTRGIPMEIIFPKSP